MEANIVKILERIAKLLFGAKSALFAQDSDSAQKPSNLSSKTSFAILSLLQIVCVLLFAAFLAAGCFANRTYMSYNAFDDIQIGTPIAVIKSEVGEPYAIHQKKEGAEEYEYIERVDREKYMAAENHYFLIVKNGKVIGKYMKTRWPPAYDLIYQDQPNYPGYPSSAVTP